MAYAQTSYKNVMGIGGKYTIHDIGCFLTSFCNLLALRYNRPVDPVALNAFFVTKGTYIDVDDGVRDDLAWASIRAYANDVIVTRVVNGGLPATNQAIVKFAYKSKVTGRNTTHFCLYDGDGYIIDSWDGKRKKISSTSYGNPVSFAEYAVSAPAATVPQNVNVGQGDEMIANVEQAQLAYGLLRPNGSASQDEINSTAGKRSWYNFAKDAQVEVKARNENLAAQAQNLAAAQQTNGSLQATIADLNSKLNDANLSNADKQQALDQALAQIAADNNTMAGLHTQIATLQKSVAVGDVIDQSLTKADKGTLLQRVLALVMRLRK